MSRDRWRPYRASSLPNRRRASLLLVAIFTVLVLVTRLACIDTNNRTAFWPANGVLVVALLLLPWRLAIPVLAACLSVNLAVNAFCGFGTFEVIVDASLNIVVSLIAAVLTRRFCGARIDLSRFRRLIAFGTVAFASAAIEAGIGEMIEPDSGNLIACLTEALQWTLCDGLGLLLATPALLLCFAGGSRSYPCDAGPVERCLLLAGTASLAAVSFSLPHSPTFMLIYPILILTAFRAGPPWVFASILITSLIAAALTIHQYGPFVLLSSRSILLSHGMIQPFLVSIFLCAVPANNALGEKSRAIRRILQMKEAVEHAATHDTLTTLVNRDLFRVRLGNLLRSREKFALLYIDLDRFKLVNDTMGHIAGDQLLRIFGARLLTLVEPDTTVARFGGDEFAMLVRHRPGETALDQLCRRIIDVTRLPFLLSAGPAYVSASIGLALGPAGACDPNELMRRADIALYAAKSAGRDGYRLFSEELDRASFDRDRLRADLEAALEGGDQLRLVYQVKVGIDDVARGVEALLRWQHPVRGAIPVQDTIAIAEETGLIIPLGAWVLRNALAFAARWPMLTVALNVSPVQLRHPGYVASVLELIRSSEVARGRIELEITETALLEDNESIAAKLACLRAGGLRIALDDFGTGFSSLRHLHQCAVDRIKIDRSFVAAIGQSEKATAIVRAVIQLGHALGLQVTAEGVETEAQRQFLVEAHIDELQGYIFARPVDEALFMVGGDKCRRWRLVADDRLDAARSGDATQAGPIEAVGIAA